ncbi:MAG: hypothetical protein JNK14_04820 [Chitinophagaceae bacterium]|nr:hypothetical protein [Chitinophagaceae bacterium]
MIIKSTRTWLSIVMIVIAGCLLAGSCKKKFDDPPGTGDPGIVANTTIKALKARYTTLGTEVAIEDDVVIEGIVSCDDRSGNFYQQIAIQDSTGGILLRLAGNNLFNNYPVGRKIFVKCKGLYLGDYGRMIQLGGGIDAVGGGVTLLAVNLQDQHIIKGAVGHTIIPKVVTVAQLSTNSQDPYINTVIRLVGFEFSGSDLSKNYADDDQSGNRIIKDCSNNQITLRTSNYSNFATLPVAQGNGEITGVYSIFSSTKQFTIRDTTDVRFYGARCPTPAGGGSIALTTSPVTLNFDAIGTGGLPAGVYIKQDANAGALGNEATVYQGSFTTQTVWNQTSLGFKNFASATGLTSTATSTTQNASTNRALGARQTGTANTGGDPGYAFAFQLANTTGKTNLKLEFLLQSLDGISAAGRTTTWKVDYGFGDDPGLFTAATTIPATLTTAFGTFASTPVTVNFGTALNNISQRIWIRIVALTNTTGGGNRASTGIDDVRFSWN